MNRLRGAYLEIDPDLARHFVTGVGEEADAIFKTFGSQPGVPGSLNVGNFHSFVTTPATIAFVDAMLGAALAAIVAVQLTDAMAPAAGVGVVSFIGISCALALVGYRNQAMAHLAPATRSSNQDVAPKKPQETSQ
jgi:ABC-type lipoprotein release transport system permease subunit